MQERENSMAADPGAAARELIRAADRAALGTIMRPRENGAADGHPYTSLVLAACAQDATPVLLLSDLADHAKNIAADGRVSLLYDGTQGLDDPLTGARVSLLGRAERSEDPALRARYLARHPSAVDYAEFSDFAVYRVSVERAHLVAGFGKIHWLDGEKVLCQTDDAGELATAETGIVAHMNADHSEAIGVYATKLLGLSAGPWAAGASVMTGIDPEGLDLRAGGQVARLSFARPVFDSAAARAELVRLAEAARAK